PQSRENPFALRLRYVAASPWFRAGPDLHIDVPIARPSVLRQGLLAIVVLGLAAWVLAGWRRAPKTRIAPGKQPTMAPAGHAGVQVLRAAPGASGWRGTVIDAHEASPVAGARLRIVAPTFEGDGVVATATADATGFFELQGSHRSDARLVVESDFHSSYEQ